MEDNSSNSPREDNNCGDGEEEEDRDQGTDEKGSSSSYVEGPSGKKPPSSSRQMRNLAEKQRRTKLNAAINDLSQLVPMISNSSKKIEKTSVLRLSAVYLRLTQVLLGYRANNEAMPQFLNEINVCDLLLDDNDIFIMVASTGKIVFVSHSVENILGHQQVDLMGHSLYNITCIEDHVELANNLKVKDELLPTSDSQTPVNDTTVITKKKNEPRYIKQRRSFYMRLVKKQASRGKQQPELELVHVVGTLMIPNLRAKDSLVGGNDIILAAVVRPFNECRVTEVSLLEATREEYITRHQIDGRIIYVDQRISIVSGFMPHEVSGTMAFTYMHKDDVRWVMIALRQMYFMGQSFGSSCYRLLSKNGEFVYMKTHGYLELNPNEDSIESFVCINTLVSPEEGKREILKMREKYSVLIENQSEPGITAITDNELMEADSNTSLEDAVTEDPVKLHKVVKQMILNIPGPAIDNVKETAQNPLPHLQFMKVALLSKSLPKIKPETDAPKINKGSSLSPKSNATPPTQNRPSVLRKAPSISGQPVLIYNDQTIANSTENDREYFEQRGGVLVLPKRHNDLNIIAEHSSKKQKVFETEIDSPSCSQYSNQLMDDSQSDNQLSTDDYGSVDEFSSINTPIQFSAHNVDEHSIELDSLTEENITALDAFSKTLDNETSIDPLFLTPESYISYDPGPYAEGNSSDVIQDSIMHVLQQDGCKGSELLQSKQIALKTKMDQRQGQLTEIQTELNSLSSNADTHFLTANFSNLKAAHEEQQQMLQSLTEVHNNIGV